MGVYLRFAVFIALLFSTRLWPASKTPAFYNETLLFRIEWKGIRAGDITMRSRSEGTNYLAINARVNSLNIVHGIYYVQGAFASKWNYATQTPVIAYEEAFQGDLYQQRKFRFAKGKVSIHKNEKIFFEHSYPHSSPPKAAWTEDIDVSTQGGYQDLLGAFYLVRSTGRIPKVGEKLKIPVLPAGMRRSLVLRVVDRGVHTDVPFFGTREIFHVRCALVDDDNNKTQMGSNMFFNTKSEIEMWITADVDFIPVKIWTAVPYLGTAYILLEGYSQP